MSGGYVSGLASASLNEGKANGKNGGWIGKVGLPKRSVFLTGYNTKQRAMNPSRSQFFFWGRGFFLPWMIINPVAYIVYNPIIGQDCIFVSIPMNTPLATTKADQPYCWPAENSCRIFMIPPNATAMAQLLNKSDIVLPRCNTNSGNAKHIVRNHFAENSFLNKSFIVSTSAMNPKNAAKLEALNLPVINTKNPCM